MLALQEITISFQTMCIKLLKMMTDQTDGPAFLTSLADFLGFKTKFHSFGLSHFPCVKADSLTHSSRSRFNVFFFWRQCPSDLAN